MVSASGAGGLVGATALGPETGAGRDPPSTSIVTLKAEAERHNFIVPRRAMPIAAAIERIGALVAERGITALGAMTAADALREQGRYPDALREYDRAGVLYLSVLDDVGWARTRL